MSGRSIGWSSPAKRAGLSAARQRRLKKKIKGSNNWLKLQNKIAKFHEKLANKRRNWHFKLAHYLCDQTDNIFVELAKSLGAA